MHGPNLEKQNCISSKTNNNQTSAEKHPLPLAWQQSRGPRASGCHWGGCQGCWHPPGRWSQGRCWLPPSPGLPCFADASQYAVSGSIFHSLAAPSLSHWGLFPSLFCWVPLSFVSPFLTFLFRKAWLGHACTEKKPTSSQLPALPLAYCSSFMFDSNSTIYTAESSGPNRTSQEPARNLSFS